MIATLILILLAVWVAACIIDLIVDGVREIRWERSIAQRRLINELLNHPERNDR